MKFGLDIFGIEPQFYSDLALVEKQTEQLQQIWDTKEEWDVEWESWKDQKFTGLDTQQMEDRAGEILEKLKSFLNQDRDIKSWGIYEFLKNKIESFRNIIPLINDLRSDALRERHWKQLKMEIVEDFDEKGDDFTLEKVISLNLD